jgi:hypothetical protein
LGRGAIFAAGFASVIWFYGRGCLEWRIPVGDLMRTEDFK